MSSITTNTSTLLADPILAPFLTPSFSAVNYVNSALPPLLPPSTALPTQPKHDSKAQLHQQLSQPSHISSNLNPNALPLSQIHPKTTSLLSVLDIQTHRLIAHLQALTDEILRVAPRLSYEVEVLRGGVVGLGEDLQRLGSKVARFSPSDTGTHPTLVAEAGKRESKPEVLKKLETLSIIRSKLEEVIAIFGEAMNWPLPATIAESMAPNVPTTLGVNSPSYYNLSPAPSPPPFIKEMNRTTNAAKAATKTINPAAEISYLLAANLVPQARDRVEELRFLAGVFKGTVEGDTRLEIVDELARRVKEAERLRDIKDKGFPGMEERMIIPQRARREEVKEDSGGEIGGGKMDGKEEATSGPSGFGVGREGYYGLINQLQRMRGMG